MIISFLFFLFLVPIDVHAQQIENHGDYLSQKSRLMIKPKIHVKRLPKSLDRFLKKRGYSVIDYSKNFDHRIVGRSFDKLYLRRDDKMISIKAGQKLSETKYNIIYTLPNDPDIKLVSLKNKTFGAMTFTFFNFTDSELARFTKRFAPFYKKDVNKIRSVGWLDFLFPINSAHAKTNKDSFCYDGSSGSIATIAGSIAMSCARDIFLSQKGILTSFFTNTAYGAIENAVKGQPSAIQRQIKEIRQVWSSNSGKYPRSESEWWDIQKQYANVKQLSKAALSFAQEYIMLKLKQMKGAWANLTKNWNKIPSETIGKVICSVGAITYPAVRCGFGHVHKCASVVTQLGSLSTKVNGLIAAGMVTYAATSKGLKSAGQCSGKPQEQSPAPRNQIRAGRI